MGQHTDGVPFTRSPGRTPSSARPIAFVLTALAVAAIVVLGSLARSEGDSFHFPSSLAAGEPAAAAVPGPVTAAPRHATPKPATTPSKHPHTPATTSAYTVTYGFDGGAGDLATGLHGSPKLSVKTSNGGALRTTKHGSGSAIGFPELCSDPDATSCPRVILETTGDVGRLNPGSKRIQFGAAIKMRKDQTSDGENIVQKGFATGGSEYKLQVDGIAGMPSCAVVGVSNSKIYLAKSSVAIDDGAWHVVACDLHGGVLSITVDGTVRGNRSVPNSLVVSNSDDLRIGGKGTSTNNDQFDGEMDDVWVTVGS
jgi:hypothetical protein